MKLAISYALAQSTKLSVHEKRVTDIVLETKNLPEVRHVHRSVVWLRVRGGFNGRGARRMLGKDAVRGPPPRVSPALGATPRLQPCATGNCHVKVSCVVRLCVTCLRYT